MSQHSQDMPALEDIDDIEDNRYSGIKLIEEVRGGSVTMYEFIHL